MSITPVPISIVLVLAPTAASKGNGEESWLAKWWTRKYAPSAPSSSAATARSMDCNRASDAERVCDWGEGVQCPNERNPMLFMKGETPRRRPLFLVRGRATGAVSISRTTSHVPHIDVVPIDRRFRFLTPHPGVPGGVKRPGVSPPDQRSTE